MQYVDSPQDLQNMLYEYAYGSAPSELKQKLTTIPGSQADLISQAPRILYAHWDLLNDQGKEIMGMIFEYGMAKNWSLWAEQNNARAVVDLIEGSIEEVDAPAPDTQLRGGVDWRSPPPPPEPAPPQEEED